MAGLRRVDRGGSIVVSRLNAGLICLPRHGHRVAVAYFLWKIG
jgi:hypothetical protein